MSRKFASDLAVENRFKLGKTQNVLSLWNSSVPEKFYRNMFSLKAKMTLEYHYWLIFNGQYCPFSHCSVGGDCRG
jgi:hypothetical protein